MNDELIKILEKQKKALGFSIIPIALSYLIITHEENKLKGIPSYFTDEEIKGLSLLNRLISLGLIIYFAITIYDTYKVLQKYGINSSNLVLQLIASTFNVIAASISLLALLVSNNNITTTENSIL